MFMEGVSSVTVLQLLVNFNPHFFYMTLFFPTLIRQAAFCIFFQRNFTVSENRNFLIHHLNVTKTVHDFTFINQLSSVCKSFHTLGEKISKFCFFFLSIYMKNVNVWCKEKINVRSGRPLDPLKSLHPL